MPTAAARCLHPRRPAAQGLYCSVSCRERAEYARWEAKQAEQRERDRVQSEAEWEAREKDREAEAEREYRRAQAGGAVEANARWERLYDETLDKYGGRYGLCQWEDEDDSGEYTGRRCTRRTTADVIAGDTTASSSVSPSDGGGREPPRPIGGTHHRPGELSLFSRTAKGPGAEARRAGRLGRLVRRRGGSA